MEEECSKCLKTEREVKLLDAIENNEIIKICEECALIEDIPVIRKPTDYQLQAYKKPATVYERLSKMAGINAPQPKTAKKDEVQQVMKKLMQPKPYAPPEPDTSKLSIKQRQEFLKKTTQPLELINNFHWYIQMARRKRKISAKQLGEAIGESEETIKEIELGKFSFELNKTIRKIEQYLNIKLTKPEFEQEQARIMSAKQPARVLNFDQEKMKNLTLADLVQLKKQKEQAEKQETEQKDEQANTIEDIEFTDEDE